MIVRLKHEKHGIKYVYHEGELASDLKLGWTVDEEPLPVVTEEEEIDQATIDLYQSKFGKKPHHRMKLETILAELNAHSE